jgi:hypothetical protein
MTRQPYEFAPPPKSMRDKTRAAVCPKCQRGYTQSPAMIRTMTDEGPDERIVWVPAHCPPCERRRMRL